MIWVEMATQLRRLPATGAFFAFLAPKHEAGSGGECRAVAVVKPRSCGSAARSGQGAAGGRSFGAALGAVSGLVAWARRRPFLGALQGVSPSTAGTARGARFFARMHILDSHTGTHLVPPSFSLPGARLRRRALRHRDAPTARRVRAALRSARHEQDDDRTGAHREDDGPGARGGTCAVYWGRPIRGAWASLARDYGRDPLGLRGRPRAHRTRRCRAVPLGPHRPHVPALPLGAKVHRGASGR